MTQRRVVITGAGLLTPIGHGLDGFWRGVQSGSCGIGPVQRFDASPFRSQLAAEIRDFEPLDYLDRRAARRLDRFSQLAIAASRQALECAGLPDSAEVHAETGVYLGSALGGIAFGEEQHRRYLDAGLHAVDPSLALAVFGGAGATNVSIEFGLRGPAIGNANSCASGAIAVGEAFRAVRSGTVSTVLAGGVEAPLAPLTFGAFALIKAMSRRNDDPLTASRPFDRDRDGFVMGEGAAMMVVEELGQALARGAWPLAEIVGYASTNDAYHMVAPRPCGSEAARAMTLALEDANVRPCEIDYLNAHATSTPKGDAAEALAIERAFGERAKWLPVSATKGLYGHPLGASGAIETVLTALVLQRSWLPPTTNLRQTEEDCRLNLLRDHCEQGNPTLAMTNSFGFGGINASLVLRQWTEAQHGDPSAGTMSPA